MRSAVPLAVIVTLLVGISAWPVEGQQTQSVLASAQLVKEFDVPTPGAGPLAITVDQSGKVWFTENNVSAIGSLDPTSGRWAEYTVPTLPKNPSSETLAPIGWQMYDIKTDAQGNVWFTSEVGSQVVEFQPSTAKFTGYTIGGTSYRGNASEPFHILLSGGIVWVSELNGKSIGMLNTTTGIVKQYYVANQATVGGATFGPGGQIWFVVPEGLYKVGVFNPATGEIRLFQSVIVDANSTLAEEPSMIEWDNSSGLMWVTDHASSTVYSFDPLHPQNDSWKAYWTSPAPTLTNDLRSEPFGLAIDPHGNVWFTEPAANRVAVLRPSSGTMTEYAVPTPNSIPEGIAIDGQGRVWFAELGGNKIGMIDPVTPPPFTVDTSEKSITVAQGGAFVVPMTVSEAPGYNPGSTLKVWFMGIPYQYIPNQSVSSGTSTGGSGSSILQLLVRTTSSLPTGTYTATVSLSSPTITQGVIIDVTVTGPQGGWTASIAVMASVAVVAGLALAWLAVRRRRNARGRG